MLGLANILISTVPTFKYQLQISEVFRKNLMVSMLHLYHTIRRKWRCTILSINLHLL